MAKLNQHQTNPLYQVGTKYHINQPFCAGGIQTEKADSQINLNWWFGLDLAAKSCVLLRPFLDGEVLKNMYI